MHAGLFPVSLSDDPMGGCKLNATHPTRRLRLTDFPALKVELQDWKHKLITLWREPTDRVPLVAVPAHTRVEVGESSSGCKLNATQDLLAGGRAWGVCSWHTNRTRLGQHEGAPSWREPRSNGARERDRNAGVHLVR